NPFRWGSATYSPCQSNRCGTCWCDVRIR
ncbi:UvrABC system protein A, partial [Haemophilus influenzae]